MVSPAHCCQELSPGMQGTGMLFDKRPWYQDTPYGSRNASALLSWCHSCAEPRCPRVSVTASLSTTVGLSWAGLGMESPEEQEGYKTRGKETPVWRPPRTAFGPWLGCKWTHKDWQKVMWSLHHPHNLSLPPCGSPADQGMAVLASQKG